MPPGWVPRLRCTSKNPWTSSSTSSNRRVLCPLGAFLGVFSRFALFGMTKDHAKCTDCNLCLVHCQGADSPQGGVKWRQDECHMCMNCENACPEDVIKFTFLPNRRSTIVAPEATFR